MDSNDLSYEPMDIDLSSQSVKDMDISYNESNVDYHGSSSANAVPPSPRQSSLSYTSPIKSPIVKKFHINIQKPPKSSKNIVIKTIAALIIIIVSIVTYHVHSLKCCDDLNFEVLSVTLSNKLLGQSAAVAHIIKSLEVKGNSKILFFSGGTGVGKTYTSALLIDTIGTCSNVYHYTMPTFRKTFSSDLMFGLTMCKISLIIVDDLTINDNDVNIQIANVIEKSESLGKEITVILIYNCNEGFKNCDDSFKERLLDNFSEIKAFKYFIQFKPLSEQHLKECIKKELGTKELNHLEFEKVLKNFNVTVDGCKGVHSKIKYLNTI